MAREPESPLMQRIQARLDRLGLSPEAASKKAGLHRDFIRNIKRGKSKSPGVEQLTQLARRGLECTPEYLIGEDIAAPPEPTSRTEPQMSARELVSIAGEEYALLPVYDL